MSYASSEAATGLGLQVKPKHVRFDGGILEQLSPIGIIHTPYTSKDECPIQPTYATDAEGTVTVFDQYADGLKDIETFTHVYLLYTFDRAGESELVRPPFLDDEPHGVFASRHPCRPNGIGMSVVRLLRRDGNTLLVLGVDMLNDTPLLDIKPYIARFDRIDDANDGWLADRPWREKPTDWE